MALRAWSKTAISRLVPYRTSPYRGDSPVSILISVVLPAPFRADKRHAVAAQHPQIEGFQDHAIAERLGDALGVDDALARPLAGVQLHRGALTADLAGAFLAQRGPTRGPGP